VKSLDAVATTPVPQCHVRIVVAVTLIAGGILVATTIRAEQSTAQFVVAGLSLAGVWVLGFLAARRFRHEPVEHAIRHAVIGVAIGLAMFVAFVAIAWAARRLEVLDEPIDGILRTADARTRTWLLVVAVVNGVAEELFFRGALVDALPSRYAASGSTVIYVAVTSAGGNVALALAALVLGTVFVAARLRTRSLVTPIAAHVTWSLLVITSFPRP
jgi:membrane protease YdiL (CAAX protease family)